MMNRWIASTLLALAMPTLALAQGDGGVGTEVRLDTGNIELAVIDGTTISVAPGSHLTIDPAKGPGEVTHITVLKGEFRISNVFHQHSNIILIHTGELTFELNRGAALIQHDGTNPQGTLLHGTSLGLQGRQNTLTQPGMRLRLQSGDGGVRQERVDPEALNKVMNKVSGGTVLAGVGGSTPEMNLRGNAIRRPDSRRLRSQVLQRSDFKTLVDAKQGLGVQLLPSPEPPNVNLPNIPIPNQPPVVHPPRVNPPQGNPQIPPQQPP